MITPAAVVFTSLSISYDLKGSWGHLIGLMTTILRMVDLVHPDIVHVVNLNIFRPSSRM